MKKLLGSLAVLGALFAAPVHADAPAQGTKVTVVSQQNVPEAEALVKALEQPGGEHEVRVQVRREGDRRTITLELWGNTIDQGQIEQVLRDKFSDLSSAQITVEAIDTPPPAIEGKGKRGHRVIIRKEVREEDDSGS